MFKLELDVPKFFSLSSTSSNLFVDMQGCGCIKGNFSLSSNIIKSSIDHDVSTPSKALRFGAEVGDILGRVNVMNRDKNLHTTDPSLAKILDRAESIFAGWSGRRLRRPQFAKLFVVRALRWFGYISKEHIVDTNVKEVQGVK